MTVARPSRIPPPATPVTWLRMAARPMPEAGAIGWGMVPAEGGSGEANPGALGGGGAYMGGGGVEGFEGRDGSDMAQILARA